MPETSDIAVQAQLDLLKSLHDRGLLTDDKYRDEIAQLGLDPAALIPHTATTGDVTTALSGQFESAVAASGNAHDLRNAQGSVLNPSGPVEQTYITITGDGAKVIIGEAPVEMPAVDRDSALGHYLRHLIAQNRYLQLQGIRAGGKLVNIELEQIYVRLRATRQRTVQAEEEWLQTEADLAPGEGLRKHWAAEAGPRVYTETVTVSVDEALAAHPRLVVLGDPGSGKTTLLRYLALGYARSWAEGRSAPLPDEPRRLPLLIPLRRLGAYLKAHRPADDGAEGHALLLEHYAEMLKGERLDVPLGFFDPYLDTGAAVILLDGLDEVADPDLRRRVARLVEAFTRAYPRCRIIVASRIVGYTGAARLQEEYVTTTVRDFDTADVALFLRNWHLALGVGLMGPGETAQAWAEAQTAELTAAIQANARVQELAINPLLLTVIALVHRERVKLPDRRAELYAEAVAVLLGKWDEGKGVQEIAVLDGRPFEADDKKLLLQEVALRLHTAQQKEVGSVELRQWLFAHFRPLMADNRQAAQAVERFLQIIEERTGLLVSRGEGVYGFSHLTFQEYLAALAVAARDDYVGYSKQHCGDVWWREVILLEAGYLSTVSRKRTTQLIRAIADYPGETEFYHNLVLASECLRDVGSSRVEDDLETVIVGRLRRAVESKGLWRVLRGHERRQAAARALAQIGGKVYWTLPYGEPEWLEIPAGAFWMGTPADKIDEMRQRYGGERKWYEDEVQQHRVSLKSYWISRTPITNTQYRIFVEATKSPAPGYWEDGRPPKGQESHPVVNVSWHEARAYCAWLSGVTGKAVTLPSEAQWEKAARGDRDKRAYPWGDRFEAARCNGEPLGLGDTTPVGIFQEGASPYGCLDMSGNVWEWTTSLYGLWDVKKKRFKHYFKYPYDALDGREALDVSDEEAARVLRGGAFSEPDGLRCAYRYSRDPGYRNDLVGFRVVVSPSA